MRLKFLHLFAFHFLLFHARLWGHCIFVIKYCSVGSQLSCRCLLLSLSSFKALFYSLITNQLAKTQTLVSKHAITACVYNVWNKGDSWKHFFLTSWRAWITGDSGDYNNRSKTKAYRGMSAALKACQRRLNSSLLHSDICESYFKLKPHNTAHRSSRQLNRMSETKTSIYLARRYVINKL